MNIDDLDKSVCRKMFLTGSSTKEVQDFLIEKYSVPRSKTSNFCSSLRAELQMSGKLIIKSKPPEGIDEVVVEKVTSKLGKNFISIHNVGEYYYTTHLNTKGEFISNETHNYLVYNLNKSILVVKCTKTKEPINNYAGIIFTTDLTIDSKKSELDYFLNNLRRRF